MELSSGPNETHPFRDPHLTIFFALLLIVVPWLAWR